MVKGNWKYNIKFYLTMQIIYVATNKTGHAAPFCIIYFLYQHTSFEFLLYNVLPTKTYYFPIMKIT